MLCFCRGLELVVATQHVYNLVHVHLLHVLASGLQILARIEMTGVLVEVLADGSCHGETRVRVDVDLANSALACFAELLFGNTHCIGELATMSVDGIYLVLRNGAGTVEYDGETRKLLLDLVQNVECKSLWIPEPCTFWELSRNSEHR